METDTLTETEQDGLDCNFENCGHLATDAVIHPQRGRMRVCPVHAENIRDLDQSRFGGGTA